MLVPEKFDYGNKTYALNLDKMEAIQHRDYAYRFMLERQETGEEIISHVFEYTFPAYFLSTKQSTKGALSFGTVNISFSDYWAKEIDGLDTYGGLTAQEVLDLAENVKEGRDKVKEISTLTQGLFGNRCAWTDKTMSDEAYRDLVEAKFALPDVPKGMTGWFKFYKN